LGSTALLGAIALSGAASAQQVTTRAPFTLNIGGAFTSYLGVNGGGDEGLTSGLASSTGKKNYDFLTETLLQFAASAKTDNGLTYGATMRRYFGATGSNQSATVDYDRSWVFVSGSFGRVDFGDANSVRAMVQTTAVNAVGPAMGNGLGADGGMAALLYNYGPAGSAGMSASTAMGNYTNYGAGSTTRRTKLNYTTPNFSGFQAGIAYIPSANGLGNTFDRQDTLTGGASPATHNGRNYRDAVELGARYTLDVSGVQIIPAIGYLTASAFKTPTGTRSLEDTSSVNAGVTVNYMGASLGIGYTNSFSSGLAKNNGTGANAGGAQFKDDSEGFVVALGYVTGPWAVSGYYQYATAEGDQSIAGNDTLRFFEIAGGYTLAPGMQLWTAVHNYEFKNEGAAKANGTIFLLGTTVSF
jgi:outer membrane protein OmpU